MNQVIQQVSDFLQTLSWIDYVIAIGVVRGIVVGYKSGGFVELIRWVVLFLTLASLVAFTATLAAYVKNHTLLSEGVAEKTVIVALGLLTFMLLKGITGVILKFASMENNWVMKVLGITLGGLRWVVLLSFGLYVVAALKLPVISKEALETSRWGGAVEPIAPSVVDFATGIVPKATLNLK